MSNSVSVPDILPPEHPVTAQEWADRVSLFWHRTTEGIKGTCLSLAEAHERLGKTEYRRMFGDQDDHVERPIPFGYNSGQNLKKVGQGDLPHFDYNQSLPPSWQSWVKLDRLQRRAPDEFATYLDEGDINPEMSQSDVNKLLAFHSYKARQQKFDEEANTEGESWQLINDDFRNVAIAEQVDAILTDPPYPDEFLPLWSDLAEWASKLLRPGGVLIAWSGQKRLPEILPMMSEHLRYGWTLALDLPGSQSKFIDSNMYQTWKPILVYVKDKWPPHDWGPDRVESPRREKTRYEWEQSVEPAMDMLDRLVSPGGLVVDPFCGVGSFGEAALRSGRRFVGIELDEERAKAAGERLEAL